MGRWAQYRKRGRGVGGTSSLPAPVSGVDFVLGITDLGGDVLEVDMNAITLVPGADSLAVRHSADGGATWTLQGFYDDGAPIFVVDGTVGAAGDHPGGILVECAWGLALDVISDWSAPVAEP